MWRVRPSATSHSRIIHDRRLARDQGWFLIIFVFKVALGFVVFAAKPLLGAAFLLIYAIYTWTEVRSKSSEDIAEPLAPLRLRSVPNDVPAHVIGRVLLLIVPPARAGQPIADEMGAVFHKLDRAFSRTDRRSSDRPLPFSDGLAGRLPGSLGIASAVTSS